MPRDEQGRLVERQEQPVQVIGHVANDLASPAKHDPPDHGHVQLAGRAGVSEKTAARTQALGNKRPDLLEKVAAGNVKPGVPPASNTGVLNT